ncbi:MAG TPA: GIY-YIG nuclease family protein [Terriglobales bacterium]|nr:GIY-YIG nuclease family protein [Terriglobales bacterium]
MSNIALKDFKFFRMWPREVFRFKDESGRLHIKSIQDLRVAGVYILYRGDELYYVGKAGDLFRRLHDHANKVTDRYYPHWDYFSAFALQKTVKNAGAKMLELEAILIAAIPRATNKSTPKFKRIEIPKTLRKMLGANNPKAMAASGGS